MRARRFRSLGFRRQARRGRGRGRKMRRRLPGGVQREEDAQAPTGIALQDFGGTTQDSISWSTPSATPESFTYGWDALDQMTGAEHWLGDLRHDGAVFGRSGGWQIGTLTVNGDVREFKHGYDGSILSETTPANGTRTYINGGIDHVMWSLDSMGAETTKYWLNDINGSVYGLAGAGGNVLERQRMTAYGKVSLTDAAGAPQVFSTTGNRTGYQGLLGVPEVGVDNSRHRMYDPTTGRFLSRDPWGMVNGADVMNFCGGDPINFRDPMGTVWAWNGNNWIWFPDGSSLTPRPTNPPQNLEFAKRQFADTLMEYLYGLQQLQGGGRIDWDTWRRSGFNPNDLLADPGRTMAAIRQGAACGVCHGTYEDHGYHYTDAAMYREYGRELGEVADWYFTLTGTYSLGKIGIQAFAKGGRIFFTQAGKEMLRGGGRLAVAGMGSASMGAGMAIADIAAIARALGISVDEALKIVLANAVQIGVGSGAVAMGQIGPNELNQWLAGSGVQIKGPVGAGLAEAAADPKHHVFPQAFRQWFLDRGVNIDDYAVVLDKLTHKVMHAGNATGGWWNEEMMNAMYQREADLGRKLTADEVLKVGEKIMKQFRINNLPIVPYK